MSQRGDNVTVTHLTAQDSVLIDCSKGLEIVSEGENTIKLRTLGAGVIAIRIERPEDKR